MHYEEHRWNICADLKLQQFWLACKAETLNSPAFNVKGITERGTATTEWKKWLLSSETTPGQKNVVHPALLAKSKSYLPPLPVKLHLIKIFVKMMDKESEGLPI